jgi:hypothetical protein
MEYDCTNDTPKRTLSSSEVSASLAISLKKKPAKLWKFSACSRKPANACAAPFAASGPSPAADPTDPADPSQLCSAKPKPAACFSTALSGSGEVLEVLTVLRVRCDEGYRGGDEVQPEQGCHARGGRVEKAALGRAGRVVFMGAP